MQNAAGDDDIARAPHDRNDVYRAVVSDLVSLVEHVQKSLRLIEQTIARGTSPGSPGSSANIIVLDDVSPRYMKACAALHARDAHLGIALRPLLASSRDGHPRSATPPALLGLRALGRHVAGSL